MDITFNNYFLINYFIIYYYITIFNIGYDVEIKDIVTKNENENIRVYWNIVNSHQLYPKVLNNNPVKFMVRYKVIYFILS